MLITIIQAHLKVGSSLKFKAQFQNTLVSNTHPPHTSIVELLTNIGAYISLTEL